MIAMLRSAGFVLLCLSAMILPMGVVRADEAQTQDQTQAQDQDQLVQRGIALYEDGAYAEAKAILLPLAEAGHPQAMNYIGLMHDDGFVFSKDPKVECDWYERAAMVGYRSAMYNIATCYFNGKGRKKDNEQNRQWLIKAAELGDIDAMIHLGTMDDSKGQEFRHWMKMAADEGSQFAMFVLWLHGYKNDVPDIKVQDIVCVVSRILIFDENLNVCD